MTTTHQRASTIDAVTDLLRVSDDAIARAVTALASGDIARTEGLPEETALRFVARRTGFEARDLAQAADAARTMPSYARLLAEGALNWSQARGIARCVRVLSSAERGTVDSMLARRAPRLALAEADQIVEEVSSLVSDLRARAERVREARDIERGFLALQRRLGGGGTLYGEADEVSFATICEAIDDAAATPSGAEDDPRRRGAERLDALVGLCTASLGGSGGRNGARPARPRVLATIELDETGLAGAARVLTRVAGRPPRLSTVGAETLLCDADLTAVLFEHGRPIAVSDAIADVTAKVRAAVIARDGGCRFPSCRAPAAWCQIHHLRGRSGPQAHHPDNLVLLCKRCHDRVHRQRWSITMRPGGLMRFRLGLRRAESSPRARPVPRE